MNIEQSQRMVLFMWMNVKMIRRIAILAAVPAVLAGPVAAECYADYKAKQDDPLELHYGVIELPTEHCDNDAPAEQVVAQRIAADGWMLLNVVSIFDSSGLKERQQSAGEFYLRY